MISVMENKCTLTLEEILYILFFCLIFFAKGIGLYDGQSAFKVFLLLAVACLVWKLCIGAYACEELIKMAAVTGVCGFVYLTSGEKGLLLYGFLVIGLKRVDLRRLGYAAFAVWSAAFAGLWLMSLFHMEDTMYRVVSKLGMSHIFRWSMGYAHPNVLHITYLIWAVLLLYLLENRVNWKHYTGLAVLNLFVFMYSVSYTGVMMVFVLLAGSIYLKLRKTISKLEKLFASLVFPGCILISLAAPLILQGKAFDLVNKLLNTRLGLAKYYMQPQFYSLFGVRLADITTQSLTMDNAYVFGFITYGAIPFFLICLAYLYLIAKLLKQNRYHEVLFILVLLAAGLTEPFLFNASFKNIGFLFMGSLLYNQAGMNKKQLCLFPKGNKIFVFDLTKWENKKLSIIQKLKTSRNMIFAGMAAGIVIAVCLYHMAVKFPEGYIVRREYCEDLTEEITQFQDGQTEYDGYKYMESFINGDEIELFQGDIVTMELIRGYMMSVLLGGALGSLVPGVAVQFKKDVKHVK